MLPSRLFSNTGISRSLRSLVIPHPGIPPSIAVQLRFRLGVNPATLASGLAHFSTSRTRQNDTQYNLSEPSSKIGIEQDRTTTSQALPGKLEPRLSLTFTCSVVQCGERSTHEFSKRAYKSGVVLVQCPKCKNRYVKLYISTMENYDLRFIDT